MAFKEVQKVEYNFLGLPLQWHMLDAKRCPRCTDDLEEFERVSRWTCYTCGLKFGDHVFEKSIFFTVNRGRGYSVGPVEFKDEIPF